MINIRNKQRESRVNMCVCVCVCVYLYYMNYDDVKNYISSIFKSIWNHKNVISKLKDETTKETFTF